MAYLSGCPRKGKHPVLNSLRLPLLQRGPQQTLYVAMQYKPQHFAARISFFSQSNSIILYFL
jgi:hypothetical protein